jgi:subtilase family serine protease
MALAGATTVWALTGTREGAARASLVPSWARQANQTGLLPGATEMAGMRLVLKRPVAQEQAFEELLAAQQDPNSPQYHRWLTAEEIGERFGAPDAEIEAIRMWLEGAGLRVGAVASSRAFVTFSGPAEAVNRAFQTELHTYRVGTEVRFAPAVEPAIPSEFEPWVSTVRGLSTSLDRPMHRAKVSSGTMVEREGGAQPAMTLNSTTHWLTPADVGTIYDIPATQTGKGYTIGIVGEARTNMDDYKNFRTVTGTSFANPTEIIPTTYGGVDPGPACTASCADASAQGEA